MITESLPAKVDTYRSMVHAGITRYYETKRQEARARNSWKEVLKFAHYDFPEKQQAKKQLE